MWSAVWNSTKQNSQQSPNVAILTALPFPTGKLITAASDKERWVRKYIHETIPVHTIIGGVNKHQYINKKGDVLIDDRKTVIDEWEAHKGHGILHTNPISTLIELANKNA